jgi:hypothetical protein
LRRGRSSGFELEEVRPYCRALRIEAVLRIIQSWKLAEVSVSGLYMGKTPTTLQLTFEGSHEIEIVLAGYETWRRRFRVQPGKGIEVNLVPRQR